MGKHTQKVHAADRKAKGRGNIKKTCHGLVKVIFYSEITRIEKDIKLYCLQEMTSFG